MTTTYYKATRPDGTDFHTGIIHYEVGNTVVHPWPHKDDPTGYLSVSTVPTDCTSCEWPLRLLEVEADKVWTAKQLPNKRCTHSVRVVRELDATLALGPQGVEVAALIERCKTLTSDKFNNPVTIRTASAMAASRADALNADRDAAWDADRDASWEAVWRAAWEATIDTTNNVSWNAASAAVALLCRDLIGTDFTQAHYDLLTGPWRRVIGPLHPDDPDLREES